MSDSARLYSLTIDGKQINVAPGTTILQAARQAGVRIPTLCWHQRLDPLASCRICVVNVAGHDRPLTACDTPAEPDMQVCTDSPELRRLRQEALGYVLAHHPLDCPVCDKGGECLLQDLTYELGVSAPQIKVEGEQPGEEVDQGWPLILRHDRRCIRCGRCVAVCRQVQGVAALRFVGHGLAAHVDTADGGPLDCEFCGQCLHVCPVGALLSKPFLHRARVWDLERTTTTCAFCGVGCRINLDVRREHIRRVCPAEDGPNRGLLCVRGAFGYSFEHDPERLATPLRRQGDQLRSLSVEHALDVAAEALSAVIQTDGPAAVAALGSARMTNEEQALLARFMREAVRSPHLDSLAGLGYRQALDAVRAGLGTAHDGRIGELADHDAILVLGSDPCVEMPVAALELLAAARRNDAELLVLHNRGTKLAAEATFSRLLVPGGEAAAALALLKWLVESGRFDETFIQERTAGFQQVKEGLSRIKLESLRQWSGLGDDDLARIVNTLRRAQRPLIVIGPDLYESPGGGAAVAALIDLMLCCPLVDRPSRILLTADRCNLRGAAQICKPGPQGLDAAEIFDAAFTGQIKALLVFGVTPLTNFPNRQRLEEALAKLDCLIVCDPFLTEAASRATVVIPTATAADKSGTFTAADGTLRPVRRAVPAPERALTDMAIIEELTRRLSRGDATLSREEARAELCRVPAYQGLGHQGLQSGEFQPARVAPQPYAQQPLQIEPELLRPPEGPGFRLVAAPLLFHNGTFSTHAVKGPLMLTPKPVFRVNPLDAAELGLAEGDEARLSRKGAAISAPVTLDAEAPRGVVLAPTHFVKLDLGMLIESGRVSVVKIERA